MTIRTAALLLFTAGVALVVVSLLVPRRPSPSRAEGPVRRLLAGAGLVWPAGVLGALCTSAAVVAAALAHAITGLVVVAVLAGAAAFPLPVLAVRRRGLARRRAVLDAWPDAIDALLAAVRSGDSLPAALATAAAAGPEPLRALIGAASERARHTGDFTGAVRGIAVALGDPVSNQVVSALALAHEVGGRELAQVLRDLAGFVREERAVHRELEARQAWTVNAARVAAAGPWVVLLLLSLRGDARMAFAGAGGAVVLSVGAVLTLAGYRLMARIGRLSGGLAT